MKLKVKRKTKREEEGKKVDEVSGDSATGMSYFIYLL